MSRVFIIKTQHIIDGKFLSGAKRTVGFYRFHGEGLYRGEMLTHRVNYNGHIHIAKDFV